MIETARLILRPWREEDRVPYAAMCADPQVMRHLDGVVDAAAAAAQIDRFAADAQRGGCGFLAMERRSDRALLGYCGLRIGGHPATRVADELEIGWRLARAHWGQGYAREAAEASLARGWTDTARARISAWTVSANTPSQGLMKRIGMTHRPELDFDHPAFAPGHPLRRHLVCTIDRPHG